MCDRLLWMIGVRHSGPCRNMENFIPVTKEVNDMLKQEVEDLMKQKQEDQS